MLLFQLQFVFTGIDVSLTFTPYLLFCDLLYHTLPSFIDVLQIEYDRHCTCLVLSLFFILQYTLCFINHVKSLSMRKPCKTVRKQGWPILFKICWQVDHHTTFANASTFFQIFENHDHRRCHLYFYNFPNNMTRNQPKKVCFQTYFITYNTILLIKPQW